MEENFVLNSAFKLRTEQMHVGTVVVRAKHAHAAFRYNNSWHCIVALAAQDEFGTEVTEGCDRIWVKDEYTAGGTIQYNHADYNPEHFYEDKAIAEGLPPDTIIRKIKLYRPKL